MPTSPPRACSRCGRPAPKGQTCRCRPAWEGKVEREARGRRWRQVRDTQLRDHPYCQWTEEPCGRLATDVDHVKPLAEGGARYDRSNLQSLCATHRQRKDTRDALRGKTRLREGRLQSPPT